MDLSRFDLLKFIVKNEAQISNEYDFTRRICNKCGAFMDATSISPHRNR